MTKQVLNYEISGHGPVLVLLHGYLCSLHYWDALRSYLETDYTVVTIDLLGFGKSPKPRAADYGSDDHIRWIQQTLDECRIEGPILLAGHSMGALLALRYSSLYPDAVRKLLLMNIPLFKDHAEARRELAGTNLFFRLSLYWELHRVICPIMRNPAMRRIMRTVMPPAYRGMETYIFASSAEARSRSLHNVIETQQGMADLARLAVPATVLVGAKERPAYLENLRRVAKTPHLEILTPDTGHHMPIENPQLAVSLLQM